MAEPTTPHSLKGTSLLNHLIESKVETSRDALKVELVGKIVYNDINVFKRLRIDDVDNDLVAACTRSFEEVNKYDIQLLVDLEKQASKKDNEVLEQEEIVHKARDPNKEERSGGHGSAEETKMYKPLVRLCGYITSFGEGTTPHRKFQETSGMLKADEPHTFGFTSCSPDLTITKPGAHAAHSKLWRDRDAFLEVKPSKNQRPKEGTIAQIVAQSADYARLFMSARPFMLFCVGILIFGTEFCIGIFDRDGITFSPIRDMFKDTACFIQVVRSVSHNLSITELGSDPTIRVLSDSETEKLTGGVTYPSAVVSAIGNDLRKWCTIGPPIWSSLSFLGRGTNVWRVRKYVLGNEPGQQVLQGDEMIMKTAWRSSARLPESDIYRSILRPPKGLASFECGDDVYLNGYPVTVQNLRSQPGVYPLPENNDVPTPVLHRLILRTIGRPMWQYTSDLDLLMGFRDAILAHAGLWKQGILHRDISPGNVLLAENPNESPHGFITDLDLAHIESPALTTVANVVETFVEPQKRQDSRGNVLSDHRTPLTVRKHTTFKTVEVKRGAVMTEIVLQLSEKRPVTHKVEHDVESFIWVFSYSVMRSLYVRTSQHKEPAARAQRKNFRRVFSGAFSQTNPDQIALARVWISPALRFPLNGMVTSVVENLMSKTLMDVFEGLRSLVQITQAGIESDLNHELLLEVINKGIASLA